MTAEIASQIHGLRSQAYVKRGAALMAIEADEVLEAAKLHQEAVAMEGTADEMERVQKALAGKPHDT